MANAQKVTNQHISSNLFDIERARTSKKHRILELFQNGTTAIAEIAARVGAKPSYVAQVLQSEGLVQGYFDLYSRTSNIPNIYADQFRGVLRFRTIEDANESVQRIEDLYRKFEDQGDRAGQHQVMILALTGLNRARWSGKLEAAMIFRWWIATHL